MEINKALTFDDVLMVLNTLILPSEVNTSITLSSNLKLKIFLSSAMDTVTESKWRLQWHKMEVWGYS